MIEDDILRELRAVRDAFAQSHNYDLRAMIAALEARDLAGDWRVVRCPARRPNGFAEPLNASDQTPGPADTSR